MSSKFILSEKFPNQTCVRDGSFETLGILASKSPEEMLSYIEDEKYLKILLENKVITCILANEILAKQLLAETSLGIVICEDPRNTFFKFHNEFCKNSLYARKIFSTKIGEKCVISKLTSISETNVVIGNNVIIEDFVSIKENVVIGDNCIIRSGTVVGGIGFEFKKDQNFLYRIEHIGGVIIEDNVEIQYNCAIDKAIYPWDNTQIGEWTKIDNLVHIGHACKIGKCVLFPASTTVGGRVEIGDQVWIGVGSVISNGIQFGESSRCNIGAVVTRDVSPNGSVSGNFAIDHKKFIEHMKKIR